jgi:hypothetical protein
MPMTEDQRRARHARWKELGLDRVKADLLDGGYRLVGGSPEVREEAWAWVRAQEESGKEVVTLKPGYFGMSIDLKAAWRALMARWRRG